jgi:transcriptional regulator with XRE-family HTH domain
MGTAFKRTPELHALGRATRYLRARRELTQERLGQRAGLHRNYVGAIERGEINPTFRVLLKLSHGLDVPLSKLITDTEHLRGEQQPDTRPTRP